MVGEFFTFLEEKSGLEGITFFPKKTELKTFFFVRVFLKILTCVFSCATNRDFEMSTRHFMGFFGPQFLFAFFLTSPENQSEFSEDEFFTYIIFARVFF